MVGSHILEALVFLNGWLFDAPIADGNNHKGGTATIADGNNQLDGAPKVLTGDFLLLQLQTAATVKVDHMFLNAQCFDVPAVEGNSNCKGGSHMFLNAQCFYVPAVEGNNHTLSSSVPK